MSDNEICPECLNALDYIENWHHPSCTKQFPDGHIQLKRISMLGRIATALETYVDAQSEFAGIAYTDLAKVALVAMLEPTPKMLGEAAKAMSPGKRPTPERVSVKEKHRIRYQAMVRKALEE